jgi:DeoR family ulaG and ulaABCDEF operon transcriptional repressor
MHATVREKLILKLIGDKGFVAFEEFEREIRASPATIRRDLEKLAHSGKIKRIRGGAKEVASSALDSGGGVNFHAHLTGTPFYENIEKNRAQKEAIGKAAANFCSKGEGVMIDGGSTTLQMCPHLAGLELQVLTNSLHIVSALIGQHGTRVLVPSGAVFPEQNIILSVFGEPGMPRFHAPKLFMGAASIGEKGLMQPDIVLVAAERRLLAQAEEVIVLVDATKFGGPSGNVVCELDEIDIIITDDRITDKTAKMFEASGIKLIIA